jgi:hypothetical protein
VSFNGELQPQVAGGSGSPSDASLVTLWRDVRSTGRSAALDPFPIPATFLRLIACVHGQESADRLPNKTGPIDVPAMRSDKE